ncbi:MAG: hypothetical protein CML06_04885 [Pseudomonadales bacterium]|nr:hypothetical protein [Pseudomonadales bacterium]
MKIKTIAASVALAAVSVSANAAWTSGSIASDPSARGELILTIWNDATETSMTQDLGVETVDVLDLEIGSTWQLDQGGLDHISADTASSLMFGVSGANNDQPVFLNTLDPTAWSIYLTSPSDNLSVDYTYDKIGTTFAPYQNYANNLRDNGFQSPTSGDEDPTILLEGGIFYAGFGGRWGPEVAGITFALGADETLGVAEVGETLYGYSYQYENIANQDFDGYAVKSPGYWTVDLEVGTLSYVPVPAAVWLFASGVLGLAGVARRRRRNA